MTVQDLFDLSDKVAIVTGGAGHLGSSISEALAEARANVCICSRNEINCKKLANVLQEKSHGEIKGMKVDTSSTNSVRSCFEKILSRFGKIDILVNNASSIPVGRSDTMSDVDWIKGLDGTINGVFRCTNQVVPTMKEKRSGAIINISSMYGTVSPDPSIYGKSGYNSPPNYGAGKAATIQYSRHMACHLARFGIRVNSVSPGPFPNKKIQKNKTFISNLEKKTPMGRIGKPQELKGIIVFLASDASSYVTGQNIHVDGGWTTW